MTPSTPTPQPLPQPNALAAPALADDDEGISLVDLFDTLMDQRWLIGAVTALGVFGAGLFAWTSTPIFEANTLVQVEDTKGGPLGGMLGEAGNLFDVRSPVTAEIEILRSRTIVGQAVERLRLDLEVRPRYAPLVGEWLARRSNDLSDPGFLGMDGYVRGNEAVQVALFEVSEGLLGQTFVIAATASGLAVQTEDGQLLTSGRVGERLVFRLNGEEGAVLVSKLHAKPGAHFLVTRRSAQAVTRALQNDLQISEKGKASGIMNVSLEGDDPQRIAQVLNQITELYVRQNVDRKAAEAEKSLAFLKTQLPMLRQQLEAAEDRFSRFRNERGTFDLGAESSAMLGQMVSLRTKELELTQKRKELDERYTAEHPQVVAVESQLRTVRTEISRLERSARQLPATEQELLRLTRDVKVNSGLYTNLLDSFQQLRLVKEGKVGNVRVIDTATVPQYAIKPRKGQIVGLGLLLGLLAGAGLALLRNQWCPQLRSPEEIEQATGMGVLATVPLSARQATLAGPIAQGTPGLHLLALKHSDDAAVEGMRSLRTALQFTMLEAPNRLVMVTGPTPSIGKSFLSANLAVVLGAGGRRVLLIDADLRKGHLHKYFGVDRGVGFSDAVAGRTPVNDTIFQSIAPGVDFITTGKLPPNPAELLGSAHADELLRELTSRYDLVIVDSAPVLPVADAQALAPRAGTVLMVARAEQTSLGDLIESRKRLAQAGARVHGVVFNGLDLSRRRYGYGYSQGYRYGRYRYRQDHYGSYGQNAS